MAILWVNLQTKEVVLGTLNLMWLLAALKGGLRYRVHYIREESTICREKIKWPLIRWPY